MDDPTDPLSPLGRRLLKLDPNAYAELVPRASGNPAARDILESTRPADLIAGKLIRADDAKAMLSALWLYFDFLDESHTISQSLDNPTGSFWHAIMHRREGDFGNSKYWYARCQNHPALATMAAQAGRLVNQMPADKSLLRVVATGWNPSGLVDLVQSVHESPSDARYGVTVALQRMEWQVLFDQCARSAAGR